MADTAISAEALRDAIVAVLGDKAQHVSIALGEVTVTVSPDQYTAAMKMLRDAPGCQFEQLIDLCGVDYSTYGDGRWEGARYAVVSHLLSVSLNQRVRVRVFCADDEFPVVASVNPMWNAANCYEREALTTCTASCSKATPPCAAS